MEEAKQNHPTKHSSSSTVPQELIFDILLRLPVKSILRFRCVSKSWLSSVSSTEFIKTHLSNNKDHRLLMGFSEVKCEIYKCSFSSLFSNSVINASELSYPLEDKFDRRFWCVGSVNGLICLLKGLLANRNLVLWNPSIRKYKILPVPYVKYTSPRYGFGYDELHDDYKVVFIFHYYHDLGDCCDEVKMYSLKSDSWRNIPYIFNGLDFDERSGTFVNGKLHWVTDRYRANHPRIVSIDLALENWGIMEKLQYAESDYLSLGVFRSDLCVFSHSLGIKVDVWVMKEYGVKESWTKMFTVKYPDNIPRSYDRPYIFLSNGEILVVYELQIFMIYNPTDNSFRHLELINFDDYWQTPGIYIESLISPLSR